ncbi:hypothetical protein BDA99DRAFT_543403 [Phascolomyces articulosus]|uniref:Uncharacterized protein n=1 Tax=Phascolomyces articulosus TaxID=60185 RepID=A0AAD5P873_9FUNG|nr:hypothetical protein BDA99DRAFT_543403 [Phascolomyces articulosus]
MSSTGSLTTTFCSWPNIDTVYDNKPNENTNNNSIGVIPRSLLDQLIQDHHAIYHMEHRDQPNLLARTLVALHELGADQDQLINGYYKVYPDLVPLLQTSVEQRVLTDDSWQEYLGDLTYYRTYLSFFQQKIEEFGIDQAIQSYFFDGPLSKSIGSQLQPVVHMVFGIEYDMPDVVTQGLAYLATTFVNVEPLINQVVSSEYQYPMNTTYIEYENLLFDMVAADPRFDGRMDGTNTFHSALKVLIKSQHTLLKTYMNMMTVTPTQQDLVTLATRLIPCTKQAHRLDWFLGGGQLLASALAIQYLGQRYNNINDENHKKLARLQFLVTLCTYIVQGRPSPSPHHHSLIPQEDWTSCASTIIASGDPKSILIMQSLVKAHRLYGDDEGYLDIANFIADFVNAEGGAWCKTDDRCVR